MYRKLIRELEDYAEVAEEGNARYCAALMRQAAKALKKESPAPVAASAGHQAKA